VSLITSLVLLALAVLPLSASAWNIPGHMLSAFIAYQVLRQENPQTIDKVKALLEKHPWYATQSTSRPPARVSRILARCLCQRRELNYNAACLEIIHIQDAIGLKKRDRI
jgi:hypothetical protein